MNDYSQIYGEIDIARNPVNILGGRFSRENFNKNIEKYSVDTWVGEYTRDVPVWEMTYKEEDWDEDNDTEEEEDEEEEECQPEHVHKVLQDTLDTSKMDGRLSKLINPRKGFKFFIEQEQKMLDLMEKKQKQHRTSLQAK